MLVKTSLYLASCDSVRKLPSQEILKRFKWALVFSEKIIITPNILIDNPGMDACLQNGVVGNYLTKHSGRVVLRHNHSKDQLSVLDYFGNLPGDYIISHVDGDSENGKKKSDLTVKERRVIEARLDRVDRILDRIKAQHERITLSGDTLSVEIKKRISRCQHNHDQGRVSQSVLEQIAQDNNLSSRSDWYRYVGEKFSHEPETVRAVRSGFVDPAYNSLLIRDGEAFANDRIRRLEIPALLSFVLEKRVYDRQIEVARQAIKLAQFVHTGGFLGILSWAKEYGTDYFSEAISEKAKAGLEGVTAWENMERRLTQWIGVEIKG